MWYVIEGYDGQDVLAQRLQARPEHLARLTALRDEGRLLLAGPCPAIDSEDPGPAGFSGSVVIAGFDSLQQAQAWPMPIPMLPQASMCGCRCDRSARCCRERETDRADS